MNNIDVGSGFKIRKIGQISKMSKKRLSIPRHLSALATLTVVSFATPGSASFMDYLWKSPTELQNQTQAQFPTQQNTQQNTQPQIVNPQPQYVQNYNSESSHSWFWNLLSSVYEYNLISSLFGGWGGLGGGWGYGPRMQPGYAGGFGGGYGGGSWFGGGGPGGSWFGGGASPGAGAGSGFWGDSTKRKEKVINPEDVEHEPNFKPGASAKSKGFPLLPAPRRLLPRFRPRLRLVRESSSRDVSKAASADASQSLDKYIVRIQRPSNLCKSGEKWNFLDRKCHRILKNEVGGEQGDSRKWFSLGG